MFTRVYLEWSARALLLIRFKLFYDKQKFILFTNIEFLVSLKRIANLFVYTKALNILLQTSKQDLSKKCKYIWKSVDVTLFAFFWECN